jgi:hypothetical protein
VSCISHAVVLQGAGEGDGASAMRLSERWTKLAGTHKLELSFLHTYTVAPTHDGWAVRSTAYRYQVRDDEEREIIAYHWHPGLGVDYPHVQFKSLSAPVDLRKSHIPTGRISFEAVVRFLVDELEVEPIRDDDWRTMLDRNEEMFDRQRTWSLIPPSLARK